MAIFVGMVVTLILRKNYTYHGPIAKEQIKKKYYSNAMQGCVQFGIIPIKCP